MNREYAIRLVMQSILWNIAPVCDFTLLAGSIRRNKEDVKDVDLIVVPKVPIAAMFDDIPAGPGENNAQLDTMIADLIKAGKMVFDPFVPRNGDKLKRFKVRPEDTGPMAPPKPDWLTLEICIANYDNCGPLTVIRTGNKDFSRVCVTAWDSYGLMPHGYRQQDGYLQTLVTDGDDVKWHNLSCPNEEEYFRHFGLKPEQIPAPESRNEETAIALRDVIRTNKESAGE